MSLWCTSFYRWSLIPAWFFKGKLLNFILERNPLFNVGNIVCSISLHPFWPHYWCRCALLLNISCPLWYPLIDPFGYLQQYYIVYINLICSLDVSLLVYRRIIIMQIIVLIVHSVNVELWLTLAAAPSLPRFSLKFFIWLRFYRRFKDIRAQDTTCLILIGLGIYTALYLSLNIERDRMPECEDGTLATFRLNFDVTSKALRKGFANKKIWDESFLFL